MDERGSRVTLPVGVGFDPGGVGKGYAADLVVERLLAEGAAGACANVGGDLRVGGEGPSDGSWTIGIEHPLRPDSVQLVGLGAGAVATSARTRWVWGPQDDQRHHLIDPATDRPAASGVLSATVIAAEGWQAEVLAKAAFIAGVAEGLVLLTAAGVDGLLVDDLGSAYPTVGLERFTGPPRTSDRSGAAAMTGDRTPG